MAGSLFKGLLAGARGTSQALSDDAKLTFANYLYNQRKKQDRDASEGLTQAQTDYYNARTRALGKEPPKPEPGPPKPLTKSQVEGSALQALFDADPQFAKDYFSKDRGGTGEKGPKKPDYSKSAAFDDAMKLFPKASLSPAQSNENIMSIIKGGQPIHTIETPPLQDVQAKSDSLFNMQNYGQYEMPVSEDAVIQSLKQIPPDYTIDFDAIKQDNPHLDIQRIKSALGR